MSNLDNLPRIDIKARLTKVLSAHQAVIDGVATHAEKERARKQEMYHKRDSEHLIRDKLLPSYDRLYAACHRRHYG